MIDDDSKYQPLELYTDEEAEWTDGKSQWKLASEAEESEGDDEGDGEGNDDEDAEGDDEEGEQEGKGEGEEEMQRTVRPRTQTREEKLQHDLYVLRKLNSAFGVYNEALREAKTHTEVSSHIGHYVLLR